MSSPLRASSMFFGLLCCLVSFTYATTVTYDFNITWVTASPDGFSRPVIGINGQWPIPTIIADIGDRIVINVLNLLGNQTTSLHFHGIYMKGTSNMDGVTGLSQCPILPGASLTYNFTVCTLLLFAIPKLTMLGQSTGYLLVSFSRQGSVSGWASWTYDYPRSKGTF